MIIKFTAFIMSISFIACFVYAGNSNDKFGTKTQRILDPTPYPMIVQGPPLFNPSPLSESFESTTFPPAGWTKVQVTGGNGWNRQTVGTMPLPGWNGGVITAPPGGGNAVAYVTWTNGGATSNDLWLITSQITNVQPDDSLYFWLLKPGYTNGYLDNLDIKISTTGPTPAAFTITVAALVFPVNTSDTLWTRRGYRIGSLVTTGANIYIAFREWVTDNFNDGAAFLLDLVEVTVGPVGISENNNEVPASYSLEQNYPNPFNPSTVISYSIPRPGIVKLAVYDILGNEVRVIQDEFKSAGSYSIRFDASGLSSGVYFYRISSGSFSDTRRMTLIK